MEGGREGGREGDRERGRMSWHRFTVTMLGCHELRNTSDSAFWP